MTPLPPLPRSDSPEADAAIELVFAERAYPCNPKAAARAGWEAAARRAQQAAKASYQAGHAAARVEAEALLRDVQAARQGHYWTPELNARIDTFLKGGTT